MADSRCETLLEMSGRAFARKRSYHQLCQDIGENFYPIRADFTQTLQLEDFAGILTDGTPVNARETLGNAIDAMLRQGDWFQVGTGDQGRDKRPANAVALNRATSIMRSIVSDRRSNWAATMKEADMDWVSFGNPVLSVEESVTRDYVVFKAWHPRDCAWLLDDEGKPYTFFRKMMMSARNILKKKSSGTWTGAVSQDVTEAGRTDPGREFELLHVLMRSDELYAGDGPSQRRIRHPFISIYIECDGRSYMNERGTPVFNYLAPRLRTYANLPWGFSPMALNSLPDARMLQDVALVILEQGQKAVDPPIIGSGQVFTRDLQFYAGGFTEVDLADEQKLGDVMTTLDTGQRINVGFELKADVRALITESWLLNRLMLPSLRDMTATETAVRTEEFRRAALPFFQPIEANYHEPLLDVTFQVASNMGLISAEMFPPEMRDKDAHFTFTSPLNEAEGQKIVQQFNTVLQIAASAAQIDKTAINLLDIRKATEEALVAGGKVEWLIPEDQRQSADEEADIVSGLGKGAEIAREGAGVMADVANANIAAQNAGMA